MSLTSAMSSMVKYTNQIVGFTSASSTHANISTNSFMRVMGIEEDLSFGSISDIRESISELNQGIATAATLAYCAYTLATSKQGLDFLDQMVQGAAGVIADIADQIIDAVAHQVAMAARQIVGTVLNIVDAFQNLISSVMLLADITKDMIKSWTDWSNIRIDLDIDEENCKDIYAAIAGCMLNKLLGPYIEEFTSKIVGKINEVGNNFNDVLYENLQDANVMASFARQESFLLNKASLQIRGLTKENLLGINNQ